MSDDSEIPGNTSEEPRVPRGVWLPMSEYPRDHDPAADTYWGPTVLVRTPESKGYPYGPTHFVAHLEADMWLVRSASEPSAWEDLRQYWICRTHPGALQ